MNTVDKMDVIWKDVLSPYAVEMHDEQIDLLFDLEKVLVDKVDRLEARVKELEMFAKIKEFELSTQRARLDKYVFYTEKTLDDVCEQWIPGLMDRLNDLEKKA